MRQSFKAFQSNKISFNLPFSIKRDFIVSDFKLKKLFKKSELDKQKIHFLLFLIKNLVTFCFEGIPVLCLKLKSSF